MLLEGLYTLLSNDPNLNSTVSGRIYPLILPLNYTVPAVTFYTVSNRTDVLLNKTQINADSVEFNIWATTYHDAAYGRQALHSLLDLYQGTLSDGTVVLFTQSQDNPDFFEKDSKLFRCSTTFIFNH